MLVRFVPRQFLSWKPPQNLPLVYIINPAESYTTAWPCLAIHSTLDLFECDFALDNGAIFTVSRLGIETPSYINLDGCISQVASSVMASLRFDGAFKVYLSEFQLNSVRYPSMPSLLDVWDLSLRSRKIQARRPHTGGFHFSCFDMGNQMVKMLPY